jgi:hypothetical protein
MTDDLDVTHGAVVLELEADLVQFRGVLSQHDPREHPGLWARLAKRLWSKVFQMSPQWGPQWLDAFPTPEDLSSVLRGIGSARGAAIYILARARATVSERPESLEAEAERLERQVERFLETPEGQERKAYIDRRLTSENP